MECPFLLVGTYFMFVRIIFEGVVWEMGRQLTLGPEKGPFGPSENGGSDQLPEGRGAAEPD
jgi:hypothetical protein